jgi:hypothetical protein
MNADKINTMRLVAKLLIKHGGTLDWKLGAELLCEAADELERLGKIEAAAMETLFSSVTGNISLILDKMIALNNAMRDSQRQIGIPPEQP